MGDRIRRFYTPLVEMRVKDNDDGSVTLTGHAAVFDKWSKDMFDFREKVQKGAFARTLKDPETDVRAYWNHDTNFILARQSNDTLRMKEDDVGLAVEIDAPNTPTIRDLVIEPIRRGDVDEMSFAFSTVEDSWKRGEGNELSERTLVDVNLFDVSPVSEGAYSATDISARSAEYEEQRKRWQAEMEEFESEREEERKRIEFKCREYDLI